MMDLSPFMSYEVCPFYLSKCERLRQNLTSFKRNCRMHDVYRLARI